MRLRSKEIIVLSSMVATQNKVNRQSKLIASNTIKYSHVLQRFLKQSSNHSPDIFLLS